VAHRHNDWDKNFSGELADPASGSVQASGGVGVGGAEAINKSAGTTGLGSIYRSTARTRCS